MSSDTFRVTFTRRGVDLDLWCSTDPAGDGEATAATRSFVLLALAGAARADAPLTQALAKLKFETRRDDAAFYREHVGQFVAWTRLIRREDTYSAYARETFIEALTEKGATDADAQAAAKFPPQRFQVRAQLTEARWAEGVPDAFGTTARDVWTQDPEVNQPDLDGARAEGQGGPVVSFPQGWLDTPVASSDGRRLFVWVRHCVSERALGSPYDGASTMPGGAVVTLDAETLAVQSHLALAPLLWRDGADPRDLSRVSVSPQGDAMLLVLRPGPAVRYGLGAKAGERLEVVAAESRFFEHVQWSAGGKDFALIDRVGKLVLSFDAAGRWPGEATAVALDKERLAVVGDKVLVVWDRAKARESMRVDLIKPTEVALLPDGQVAVVAGPGGREQVRVFHADGTERSSVNMKHARRLRASPSGRLAALLAGLHLYDPETERLVELASMVSRDHAWLDDGHLAVIGDDQVQRLDVAAALEQGSTRKVKVSTPASQAAAAATPPKLKSVVVALKQRADAAIEALRARRGALCFDRASGKFKKKQLGELPAHVAALLEGCHRIEAGWVDPGVRRFFLGGIQPADVLEAKPGQHHFSLQGEALARSGALGLGAADPAGQTLTLDGKPLTREVFLEAWRPFAFYDDRWVALSPDGLRAVVGTRDLQTWKSDPRSLDQIIDDALTWLRDLA